MDGWRDGLENKVCTCSMEVSALVHGKCSQGNGRREGGGGGGYEYSFVSFVHSQSRIQLLERLLRGTIAGTYVLPQNLMVSTISVSPAISRFKTGAPEHWRFPDTVYDQ